MQRVPRAIVDLNNHPFIDIKETWVIFKNYGHFASIAHSILFHCLVKEVDSSVRPNRKLTDRYVVMNVCLHACIIVWSCELFCVFALIRLNAYSAFFSFLHSYAYMQIQSNLAQSIQIIVINLLAVKNADDVQETALSQL